MQVQEQVACIVNIVILFQYLGEMPEQMRFQIPPHNHVRQETGGAGPPPAPTQSRPAPPCLPLHSASATGHCEELTGENISN